MQWTTYRSYIYVISAIVISVEAQSSRLYATNATSAVNKFYEVYSIKHICRRTHLLYRWLIETLCHIQPRYPSLHIHMYRGSPSYILLKINNKPFLITNDKYSKIICYFFSQSQFLINKTWLFIIKYTSYCSFLFSKMVNVCIRVVDNLLFNFEIHNGLILSLQVSFRHQLRKGFTNRLND